MKNRICVLAFAVMTVLLMSLTGCSKYRQISVTSGRIESINMNGFKSVDMIVRIGVDNPAGKLEIKSAEGILKHFGKIIGRVTPDPVVIKARSDEEHVVKMHVEIAEGLGLREILGLMDARRLEECTLDISVSGKVAGMAMKKKIVDIPLKKLLESKRNEKI